MPKTKKSLDLLYHMVKWRTSDLLPAEERLNNKKRVLMKNVPGYGSRIKGYNDYPTSLDQFTNEFWHWLEDHPEYKFIRGVVLDIAEHQRAICQWLLNNPDQLNKVWQEGHPRKHYADLLMEQHRLDKLCYPDCPFCKGTAFQNSPFHCDGDHHGQEAVQAKRRHWHYNSEGEATTMLQPSQYSKEQLEDQKDGLRPVCSSRHMHDTLCKIRNDDGKYNFIHRWQYLLVTGLVLYLNDYQCFFTDDEVDFNNYTGYDTQHSTAMMNALIGEIQYASRKLSGISELWNRTYKSYAEFRDAVFREVVMVVLCKRSAHRLIDWGIARQHHFLGMPPYPFVKQTCNGTMALVPRLLPPPPTTITTTSTTTNTTLTTESPTAITTKNITRTTTITSSIITLTKVTTQQNVGQHDRELLQAEVARVDSQPKVVQQMKQAIEKEERKRKKEEEAVQQNLKFLKWKEEEEQQQLQLLKKHSITVTRSNNDKLGLKIKAFIHGEYIITQIESINPGSLFDGTALRRGMFLYSVNGVECKSYEHGRSLLKDAEESIHIMAGRVIPDIPTKDMA